MNCLRLHSLWVLEPRIGPELQIPWSSLRLLSTRTHAPTCTPTDVEDRPAGFSLSQTLLILKGVTLQQQPSPTAFSHVSFTNGLFLQKTEASQTWVPVIILTRRVLG